MIIWSRVRCPTDTPPVHPSTLCVPWKLSITGIRARGAERVCSPLSRAKSLFFGQTLNFLGRIRQPEIKKKIFLNEKTEFILSSNMKCPKSRIFINKCGWGESGKATLQVSIAVLGGSQNIFRANPPEKNWPVRLCSQSVATDNCGYEGDVNTERR